MPFSRANRRKSSAAESDTRVFNSASALPACESSPPERDQHTTGGESVLQSGGAHEAQPLSDSEFASRALASMLGNVKRALLMEYLRRIEELNAALLPLQAAPKSANGRPAE
jgi:hypothetical protein